MSKIPETSKDKILPSDNLSDQILPKETELNKEQPKETNKLTVVPNESKQIDMIPEESKPLEIIPDASPKKQEKPSDEIEENCVLVNGEKIELKPTKLKYFRNKAASAYGIIKAVPLHELLTYGKGILDETRDADQLLYDFLACSSFSSI